MAEVALETWPHSFPLEHEGRLDGVFEVDCAGCGTMNGLTADSRADAEDQFRHDGWHHVRRPNFDPTVDDTDDAWVCPDCWFDGGSVEEG